MSLILILAINPSSLLQVRQPPGKVECILLDLRQMHLPPVRPLGWDPFRPHLQAFGGGLRTAHYTDQGGGRPAAEEVTWACVSCPGSGAWKDVFCSCFCLVYYYWSLESEWEDYLKQAVESHYDRFHHRRGMWSQCGRQRMSVFGRSATLLNSWSLGLTRSSSRSCSHLWDRRTRSHRRQSSWNPCCRRLSTSCTLVQSMNLISY